MRGLGLSLLPYALLCSFFKDENLQSGHCYAVLPPFEDFCLPAIPRSFSKDENFQSAPGSRVGTPAYLAPEVISNAPGQSYDAKVGCGAGWVRRAGAWGMCVKGRGPSEETQRELLPLWEHSSRGQPSFEPPGLRCWSPQKADVWSCGVLLFALVTGAYPFVRGEDAKQAPARQLHNVVQVRRGP